MSGHATIFPAVIRVLESKAVPEGDLVPHARFGLEEVARSNQPLLRVGTQAYLSFQRLGSLPRLTV